jgi:hypothetical protein
MSEHAITSGVSIALAVIGLAIVAVLLSQKSQTSGVLTATGSSLADALTCALSPVTGASCGRSLIPVVNSRITFGL